MDGNFQNVEDDVELSSPSLNAVDKGTNEVTDSELPQNRFVNSKEDVAKSLEHAQNLVDDDDERQNSVYNGPVQIGEDEIKEGSSPSFISFFESKASDSSESAEIAVDDKGRGSPTTGQRTTTVVSLQDLLLQKGRGTLSEFYMEVRCGKLLGDSLYLDLTGRIVEEHLGRRLDDEDLTHICTFLTKNSNIIYLSLGYNLITRKGFSYLARYLAEHTTLYTLNLSQNEITSIDEVVLRNTAALWKLRCLLLRGNKFGPRGGFILGRMLKYNESLRHLDIGETEQTIQSVSRVIQSLICGYNENVSLQKLILNRLVPEFQSGFVYSSHLCRLVEQLVSSNRTIVELHLERNEISDWDLELIIPAMRHNKVLELINLTGNRLSSHGLELLSTVLPETNIQYLILASNQIGDDGAIALGRVFEKTKILFLDISMNRIHDTGMKFLLWGLKPQVPPFHTLFLYGNPFTNETTDILYRQIFLEHISPYAVDMEFIFTDGRTRLAADQTCHKYRNTYYLVHELSAYKRRLHHSCCYLPSIVNRIGTIPIHLPYRSIIPPVKDYSEEDPIYFASSAYLSYISPFSKFLRLEDGVSVQSEE